jgi:hypothetical protein
MIAEAYDFLEDYNAAIRTYEYADLFCPRRNDHLIGLAAVCEKTKDFEKMLWATTIMIKPERVNPFPQYALFIDTSMYLDGGSRVTDLHDKAKKYYSTVNNKNQELPLVIQNNYNKRIFVVDNFYSNPDEVRQFALAQEYQSDIRWYKGLRTTTPFRNNRLKNAFEIIVGEKIINWDSHGYNGVFQITTSRDPQVYHYDEQKWAAMIYLTPDAPLGSGTRTHQSKFNKVRHSSEEGVDLAFNGDFYDSTRFDTVDNIGNIYNRLVIMDARCIHSAGSYFGQNNEESRLVHLFFFD